MPAPSTYEYTEAIRTTAVTAVLNAIDAGPGPGVLRVYDESDVLLAEIALSDPAGSVSGGQLTITPGALAEIVADGVAAWGEVQDGAGAWALRAPTAAGTSAQPGFIVLSALTCIAGASISLISFVVG